MLKRVKKQDKSKFFHSENTLIYNHILLFAMLNEKSEYRNVFSFKPIYIELIKTVSLTRHKRNWY